MTRFRFNPTLSTISGIAILVLLLSSLDKTYFDLLKSSPEILSNHQYWRLLTCNFVHFGWAHTLVDTIGFLIISGTLFYHFPSIKFITLVVFCGLSVGIGMTVITSDFLYYAGLSGVIHGLLITGCLYAAEFPVWKRTLVIAITTGKIIYEQLPEYNTNPPHSFMPVAVAVDAHLYGVIAGFIFFIVDRLFRNLYSDRNIEVEK